MIIASMTVVYDFEPQTQVKYMIDSEANTSKKTALDAEVIHMCLPIADSAMKAYSQKLREFECNHYHVKLVSFDPRPRYDEFTKYPRPVSGTEIPLNYKVLPVFLYKTACHCYSCRRKYHFDDIRSVKVNVRMVTGKYRMIEVEYCRMCKKYFISELQLALYENNFGTFMISRFYQENDPEYPRSEGFFAPDSVLSRHGYYVSVERNPGDKRRQEILWMLLHNKLATKSELKEILSNFISYRSNLQVRAKAIWKEDLDFLLYLNALVGKAIALEKLSRLKEALSAYDAALALNNHPDIRKFRQRVVASL
jgi:hypothetical protein